MKVTETEKFLYYRIEALENALTESQSRLAALTNENKDLKTIILNKTLKNK